MALKGDFQFAIIFINAKIKLFGMDKDYSEIPTWCLSPKIKQNLQTVMISDAL